MASNFEEESLIQEERERNLDLARSTSGGIVGESFVGENTMASNLEEESLTQEERERSLDQVVQYWFNREIESWEWDEWHLNTESYFASVLKDYDEVFKVMLERLSAPGVLETLSANPKKWLRFSEVLRSRFMLPRNSFDLSSRRSPWDNRDGKKSALFMKLLFENRSRVPREELAHCWNVWLRNLSYKDCVGVLDSDDPLLLDADDARIERCRLQKQGWEMFRYCYRFKYYEDYEFDMRTLRTSLRFNTKLCLEDSIAKLRLKGSITIKDLSDCKSTFNNLWESILWEVLSSGETELFRSLLEKDLIPDEVIPLPELCCFLVTAFKDESAVPMLKVIEEVKPGTVGAVRDAFGRNLLWYTCYNQKTLWFATDCENGLTHFLLEHGCDPENTNQVGFSWREVCEALTKGQKIDLADRNVRSSDRFSDVSRDWWMTKCTQRQEVADAKRTRNDGIVGESFGGENTTGKNLEEESLAQEEGNLSKEVQYWFTREIDPEEFWLGMWDDDSDVPFEAMLEGLRAPGALETLSANPKKWLRFSEFLRRRCGGSYNNKRRIPVLKVIFENCSRIPRKELVLCWNLWFMNLKLERNSLSDCDDLIKDDPMFIDGVAYVDGYYRPQQPGWEMLRYVAGRKYLTPRMSKPIETALREDDGAAFAICLDTSVMNFTYSLLWEVLSSGAKTVFRVLLESDKIPEEVISLSELCCLLVTRFPDKSAVPMLEIIEEVKPGTVEAIRDAFGRNLLWYANYNKNTLWFETDCEMSLTHFLLEHGCDPENTNTVGLSWREVCESLTKTQKKWYYPRF